MKLFYLTTTPGKSFIISSIDYVIPTSDFDAFLWSYSFSILFTSIYPIALSRPNSSSSESSDIILSKSAILSKIELNS